MIKANVSTLKNHLSRYLQKVRKGQTVEVVDRDQPVARLVPVSFLKNDHEDWVNDLTRLGLINRGPMKGRKQILETPPPGRGSAQILAALLEERRGDR